MNFHNPTFFFNFLQAEEKNQKMQELNKFVHYYTRFKNHENSYKVRCTNLSITTLASKTTKTVTK